MLEQHSSTNSTNDAVDGGKGKTWSEERETLRAHFRAQIPENLKFTACKENTRLKSLDIKLPLVILVLGQIRTTREIF